MLLERLHIQSRSAIVTLAVAGIAITIASHSTAHKTAVNLAGTALFVLAVYNAHRNLAESIDQVDQTEARATAVASTLLLLTANYAHLHSWLHALLVLSACASMMLCWTLPKSPWQQLPILAIFVIALTAIQWKELRALAAIPLWIWLAMLPVWLIASLAVFRWIDRRKGSPSPTDLIQP